MKNTQGFSRMAMVFALGIGFTYAGLSAQAPPVPSDTCIISIQQRFKTLPIPGQFIPGNHKGLHTCPHLGDNVVRIGEARAGKAHHLRIELEIVGGNLMGVRAMTIGEKNFSRLYKQMLAQAGRPTRLVESGGKLSYSWETRQKVKGQVTMTYIPAETLGRVVITP